MTKEEEVLMGTSSREVVAILEPANSESVTIARSVNGFVLNQLVWDNENQCVGQIMAFYDHGDVRLDSDGCVSIDSLEPLQEKHFGQSSGLAPSMVLRMARTIQDLQTREVEKDTDNDTVSNCLTCVQFVDLVNDNGKLKVACCERDDQGLPMWGPIINDCDDYVRCARCLECKKREGEGI